MNETRRRFLGSQILTGVGVLGATSQAVAQSPVAQSKPPSSTAKAAEVPVEGRDISLDGEWEFRKDGDEVWRTVTVPHTWQVMDGLEGYYGVAFYRHKFLAPASAANAAVYLEFESVFHTAEVKLNGVVVAEHKGKGYTAFRSRELTKLGLKPGAENVLEVRVDNSFTDAMLPRSQDRKSVV